ncbi:MAG: DNA repair exonuclease [Methanomassiliicoccaceae archaeon]|jgi:DNA repair exonuclease SbcCD nuclease subunit|nr:DNA repair exonuclease [Methanomassiliicoccaceae archaeon]
MAKEFKFIHCSDLHLGAPFKKISSYDHSMGEKIVNAPFAALNRIIDKGISEKAGFIIFSGDIFDSENTTPHSRFLFAEALRRAGTAGIRCYIAYGNHDHSRMWEDSIPFPDNAIEFPSDGPVNVPYPDEKDKLADVIGISHGTSAEGRDLTADIHGTSSFSIAVVHCDIDSSSEGKRYAPCRLNDLLSKKDIDYWALGHIHKRAVLHEAPYIVYPGNTQGRSTKETDEKGAYLITVMDGKVAKMEFFATHSIMWKELEVNITGKDITSFIDSIRTIIPRGSFVKLKVSGRGVLDRMIRLEQKSMIAAIETHTGCRIAEIEASTMPDIDINERRNTGDFTSAVIKEADRLSTVPRDVLIAAICTTKASSSPEIMSVFREMDDDELRKMVNDALASVLERLAGGRR